MDEIRSKVGENALKIGGTGTQPTQVAGSGRKLQAQVDTASRPDFVGPPPPTPTPTPAPKVEPSAPLPAPDQPVPDQKPMRTAPGDVTPVEPTLPSQ
jgi:hypothetical protein